MIAGPPPEFKTVFAPGWAAQEQAPPRPPASPREQMLEFLQTNPLSSNETVAKALGLSPKATASALGSMVRRNKTITQQSIDIKGQPRMHFSVRADSNKGLL